MIEKEGLDLIRSVLKEEISGVQATADQLKDGFAALEGVVNQLKDSLSHVQAGVDHFEDRFVEFEDRSRYVQHRNMYPVMFRERQQTRPSGEAFHDPRKYWERVSPLDQD